MLSSSGKLVVAVFAAAVLIAAVANRPLLAVAEETASEKEAIEKQAKVKVQHEFFDKVKKMIDDGETRYYNVVLSIKKDLEDPTRDSLNDAKKNKDAAESDLTLYHKAKNVNKLQILSFVYADVPVDEVFNLAKYDYVRGIDDGELEGELYGDDQQANPAALSIQENPITFLAGDDANPLADKYKNPFQTDMDDARDAINADGTGYTGSGVRVGVIDTGIRQDHPDLPVGSKIIYQANCIAQPSCVEYPQPSDQVNDFFEHGTNVAGAIAAQGSSNPYRGVAYNALLVNARIDNNNANKIPLALDWVMTKQVKVVNISVGKHCVDSWTSISRAADEAVDKGVVVVAPVGKNGLLSEPGCAFNVITVGTINDNNQGDNPSGFTLASTSGPHNAAGPTFDNRIKPDVVAPGIGITATFYRASDPSILYAPKSGASHASAIVAGAVAQLVQKNPSWNPAQIKAAIKQNTFLNANLSPLSENERGKGIVDISDTLAQSLSGIDYSLAYGININTYVAEDLSTGDVEFKFGKETLGSNIGALYIHSGKMSNGGALTKVFEKFSFSGIKIAGATKTLTDNLLYAGPRVDFYANEADAYVKYNVGGDKIQLLWFVNAGAGGVSLGGISSFATFESGSGSKTLEVVQYQDFDIGSSTIDDKATRAFSPYVVHNTEQKFTTPTNFNIRDNSGSVIPWIKYTAAAGLTVTEWILVRKSPSSEPPTNNPDPYFCLCESIDGSGNGENLLVYYKQVNTGTSLLNGVTMYVNWTPPP